MNKVSAEVEKEVLERFFNGKETNISRLAKEFSLNYRTVCRIVQKDAELYRQTIEQARREATERRKQQQRESAKECMKEKRSRKNVQDEQSCAIHDYFFSIKNNQDAFGPHSEYEVAKRFGLDVAEVIAALQNFDDYQELEMYREYVLTKKMEELQRQMAFSMSKHSKLNRIQAVMLNTSAYRYDSKKKVLVYRAAAAKPKDLPSRLSAIVCFENLEENVVKEKTETEKWVSETEQQVLTSEEINSKKKKGKKKKHKKNKKHEKKPEPPIDKK